MPDDTIEIQVHGDLTYLIADHFCVLVLNPTQLSDLISKLKALETEQRLNEEV